jgi:hypothetical protein
MTNVMLDLVAAACVMLGAVALYALIHALM